ncbi:TetR/AcrR family transcriptional regulator [Listeria swaminathanii]|uniref:TetR/AcrR family transcriptional regulator n=1 Tax=Listeria swaminathanii TaxID=2713501 RepID=A0A7X0ZZ22_9LIST|nr:TetR/AcrR family transcriptional regulator [Listeria swaminathanii]UHP11537.1 TetR/AcrR family transcriptional regulator [Listeria marthii]MBC2329014.1 TetR/AcrR family transcriptional regulator [Listeria swaminathanii]MDT0016154.1 TetR/AcrR family transcriptional regulator [Listeria swaminathanii]MDT0021590.1 TetR/AcrR family transcriptional regulator [Listeria swaminathanii]MDT0032554.1 TetR/AcrR family transcriptional regulator [Listeria swaminathanii]
MNKYIKVHQPLNVDLRAQKTQTKLYTVIERFYKEGQTFESITVKDLCEQAQVSRATFYRHHEEIIQVVEVQLLRTMQYFSLKFDQTFLTKQNIQQLIIATIQENQLLFQVIFWSRAENIFLDVVSGEILRIALLKEVSFSDNKFIPNYLARMILSLAAEVHQAKKEYTNSQLIDLVQEAAHFSQK